jgi:hypothetical protein
MLYKGRFLGQLFSRVRLSMTGCVDKKLDVRFPVGARRKESFFSAVFKPALKEAHHMTGCYMGGGSFYLERGSGQGVKLALHRHYCFF